MTLGVARMPGLLSYEFGRRVLLRYKPPNQIPRIRDDTVAKPYMIVYVRLP